MRAVRPCRAACASRRSFGAQGGWGDLLLAVLHATNVFRFGVGRHVGCCGKSIMN